MQAPSRIAALAARVPPPLRSVLALVALLAPPAALFAPALGYPLLNLDDVHAVTTNPGIRELSLEGLLHLFFFDRHEMRYFPLTYVSFAIDYRIFGLDPFGYHLTNLLLHLANTALVFGFVRALTRSAAVAVATALVFGIHPLQVESVAWVSSRKNVLFMLFFLLSLWAYLPWARGRGGAGWLWASAGLYFLSCLSKTAGITLPAVLVLVDWYLAPAPPARLGAFLRRSLPSKLAYLPPAALIVLATSVFSRPNPFQTEYAFGALEWLLMVGHNLAFYLVKTLAPLELGVFYALPEPGALPAHFAVYAGLALALLALTLWSFWRGHAQLFLGLGWYGVTILPMALFAAFFSDIPILVADRYYYQSAVGVGLLAGFGGRALWARRPTLRIPLLAAAGGAVALLFAVAAEHRTAWRSTIALYEALLEHHPTDEFHYRLALEYQQAGRPTDAFRALEAAERTPRKIFFLDLCYHQMRIADVYRRKGDFANAARFVEAAIEATPNSFEPVDARTPFAYAVLARLHDRAGDGREAARARTRAATARPDPNHYFELNWIRIAPEAARSLLERRVAADPDDGLAWFYLGVQARLRGDLERAQALIGRAAELGYPP